MILLKSDVAELSGFFLKYVNVICLTQKAKACKISNACDFKVPEERLIYCVYKVLK